MCVLGGDSRITANRASLQYAYEIIYWPASAGRGEGEGTIRSSIYFSQDVGNKLSYCTIDGAIEE